jgi:hypothetical protein
MNGRIETYVYVMYGETVTYTLCLIGSCGSPVGIVTRLWAGRRVRFSAGPVIFFSLPPLWGPPSLIPSGYRGLFRQGLSCRSVKLTAHFYLVPRLRMHGAVLLFPQYILMLWGVKGTTLRFHTMILGEWKCSSTHSLTSALDADEWSASLTGRFTSRERAPGNHWIGGWVGPRAGLDAVAKRKIPIPCRGSNPRSSSL